jgi:hypothetical protein
MGKSHGKKLQEARAARKRSLTDKGSGPNAPLITENAPLVQVLSKEEQHQESANTSPPQKQQKAKHENDRDRHMQLLRTILFESAYDVVTWVLIALTVGGVLLFYGTKNWRGLLWAGCALVCLTTIMIALKAQHHLSVFAEQPLAPAPAPYSFATSAPGQLRGLLRPANEPAPKDFCGGVKEGWISVIFGSAAFTTPKSYQCLVKIDSVDVLWFEKTSDGMYVNAIVQNERGEEVARVTKNAVQVQPKSGYYAEMPDPHTLIILTPDNQKAFYVRYVNPSLMKILGTFYHHRIGPYIIEEGKRPPGVNMDNFCFVMEGGGAIIHYDPS